MRVIDRGKTPAEGNMRWIPGGKGEDSSSIKGEDPVGGNGVLSLAASSLAPFEGIAGKLMGDT